MKYGKLFQMAGKREKPPTLAPSAWTVAEQACIDKGICLACGTNRSERTSHLCRECEARQSIEDIDNEIAVIRKRLLHGS